MRCLPTPKQNVRQINWQNLANDCLEVIPIYYILNQNELYHHGVKGQKWGVRRDKARTFVSKHKTGIKRGLIITGSAAAILGIRALKKMNVNSDSKKLKGYIKKGAEAISAGTKSGVKQGLTEGPKKAVNAVIVGASMLGMKKLMDTVLTKDVAGQMFNANNSKKIGSFWSYKDGDKDD